MCYLYYARPGQIAGMNINNIMCTHTKIPKNERCKQSNNTIGPYDD